MAETTHGLMLRYIEGISQIAGARAAAATLVESGRHLLRHRIEGVVPMVYAFLEQNIADSERFRRLAPSKDQYLRSAESHQTVSLQVVLDCASLIAGHALLEEVVHECLRVSITVQPEAWARIYGKRNVKLESIVDRSSGEILQEAVAEQLEADTRRSSLVEKMKRLLGLLRADQEAITGGEYPIDMERFSQIDKRRHDVVHRGFQVLEEVGEDLRYLESAAFRFMALTCTEFDAYDRVFGSPVKVVQAPPSTEEG